MELISMNGYKKISKQCDEVNDEILACHGAMVQCTKRNNKEEYIRLKEKVAGELTTRRDKLLRRMNQCTIIEKQEAYINFKGYVIPGSKVRLEFEGKEKEISILGDKEGRPSEGIVACRTPLAKALLGKCANDTLIFDKSTIVIKDVTRI